jgi:hypothetical protein
MKNKLVAGLLLALLISLDTTVFANHLAVGAPFSPDGIPSTAQRRKRRRRARQRRRAEAIQVNAPAEEPNVQTASPPPAPQPVQEAPMKSAPPADSSPGEPGRGVEPNMGPRIKPPSVQIKPPSE